MPYREIYLGDGEWTIARVPDEVVQQWLEERRRGVLAPEQTLRPPDVDTPLMRSWILDETEAELLGHYYKTGKPMPEEDSFMVCALTSVVPIGMDAVAASKLIVTYHIPEGVYAFRFKTQSLLTGDVIFDKTKVVDCDKLTEETFAKILEFWGETMTGDPETLMITTPADIEESEEEMAQAVRDLAEWRRVH